MPSNPEPEVPIPAWATEEALFAVSLHWRDSDGGRLTEGSYIIGDVARALVAAYDRGREEGIEAAARFLERAHDQPSLASDLRENA